MSYLDVPRIHFSGGFISDPSTLDNKLRNYAGVTNQLWNPDGQHHFAFSGCTVQSAFSAKGAAPTDPVVGGLVETTGNPRAAKLVDLDAELQSNSQIIGAEVKISLKSGGGFLQGRLQRATLRELWRARAGPPGMPTAAGVFQTVFKIDTVSSDKLNSSPIMTALSQSTVIAIKFVLYGYDPNRGTAPPNPPQANFTTGKVVGTIGPFGHADGEDDTGSADFGVHFLHARRMFDPGAVATHFAPFKLNPGKKKLTIDIGNCLPEDSPRGPRTDLGTLEAVIVLPAPAAPVVIGPIDYKTRYETNAGIEELFLTDAKVKQLKTNALALRSSKLSALIVSERPSGLYVDVDEVTLRMNPGETATVSISATVFGAPKPGLTLNLAQIGNPEAQSINPGVPPDPLAKPASAISFPASVTTNALGQAGVPFTASDPGTPRSPADGQVYAIGIHSGPVGPSTLEAKVTIKVFSSHSIPASPKWADVQPIFEEYFNMYPSMRIFLKLNDPIAVQALKDRVLTLIKMDEDDPQYMPISRDLSRDKKKLIEAWVKAGAPI